MKRPNVPAKVPAPAPVSSRKRGTWILAGVVGALFLVCAGAGLGAGVLYVLIPRGEPGVALNQPRRPDPVPAAAIHPVVPVAEPPRPAAPEAETPAAPTPEQPAPPAPAPARAEPAPAETPKPAAPAPAREVAAEPAQPAPPPASPPPPARAASPAEPPAPVAEKLPVKAVVGRQLRYTLPAAGTAGRLQLASGPRGMVVAGDGQVLWRPGADDVGTKEFVVHAVDGGQTKALRFRIEVIADPTLKDQSTLPVKAVVGKPFRYQLPSADGSIKYDMNAEAKKRYDGLDLSPDGLLTWTPPAGTASGTYDIPVSVDGEWRRYRLEVEDSPDSAVALPAPAGWVMLPDGVTLIASLPDKAQLVYIDTLAVKETKRVEVNFKPSALAFQGNKLFAAAEGSGLLYVLDLMTGAVQKEVKASDAALVALACHPEKGLVYASNSQTRIVAVDPETGTAYDTRAQGTYLAIDPVKGSALYAGIQGQIRDVIVVRRVGGGQYSLSGRTVGKHAALLKYAVNGTSLQPVGVNDNAADNGHVLRITADGKRVAIPGGGGYRPSANGAGANFEAYGVALFSTDDVKTMLGVAKCGAYPNNLAFHPVLELGVVEQAGANTLHVFKSGSMVETEAIPFTQPNGGGPAPGARTMPSLLAFGGKGTKLLYHDGRGSHLHFVPLKLSDADKEALAKAYDK